MVDRKLLDQALDLMEKREFAKAEEILLKFEEPDTLVLNNIGLCQMNLGRF